MKSWSIVVFLMAIWWQWWGNSTYSPDSPSVDSLVFFLLAVLTWCFSFSPVPSYHTLFATPPSNVFLNLLCCVLNLSVSPESCGYGETDLLLFANRLSYIWKILSWPLVSLFLAELHFILFFLFSSQMSYFSNSVMFLLLLLGFLPVDLFWNLLKTGYSIVLEALSVMSRTEQLLHDSCMSHCTFLCGICLSQQRIFQFLKLALNSVFQKAGSFLFNDWRFLFYLDHEY